MHFERRWCVLALRVPLQWTSGSCSSSHRLPLSFASLKPTDTLSICLSPWFRQSASACFVFFFSSYIMRCLHSSLDASTCFPPLQAWRARLLSPSHVWNLPCSSRVERCLTSFWIHAHHRFIKSKLYFYSLPLLLSPSTLNMTCLSTLSRLPSVPVLVVSHI